MLVQPLCLRPAFYMTVQPPSCDKTFGRMLVACHLKDQRKAIRVIQKGTKTVASRPPRHRASSTPIKWYALQEPS